jgi:uncharacterized oxidoreductase
VDFAGDVARLTGWVKASPPMEPGGSVLLPGEIEARTTQERSRDGIPLDPETLSQLRQTAALLSIAVPPEFAS